MNYQCSALSCTQKENTEGEEYVNTDIYIYDVGICWKGSVACIQGNMGTYKGAHVHCFCSAYAGYTVCIGFCLCGIYTADNSGRERIDKG